MNKRITILLFPILFLSSIVSYANPGDTTLVQCFSFDSIHTRRGWFEFPEQGQEWNKILMYYTLKCDPQTPHDSYACGEWDYTTFSYIFEHTGVLDSTEYTSPLFTVNGDNPDIFYYSNEPTHQLIPRTESFLIHSDTTSLSFSQIGTGTSIGTTPFTANGIDGKVYYYFPAVELIANGLTAGNITGMNFDFASSGALFQSLRLELASTDIVDPSLQDFQNIDYTEVFNRNLNIIIPGWKLLDFANYYNWDGVSDLVISVSYENSWGNCSLNGTEMAYNAGWQSIDPDLAIDFEGSDYVDISPESFSDTQNEISIAFWLFGDPDIQPQSDMLVEARDADGNRVICIHLPWDNGSVYWDAGNEGSANDRIYKAADFDQYAGQWTHWAFTKNATTGEMKIYVNGELWHEGTGLTRTMDGIERFFLGGDRVLNPIRFYDGMLDDFYVLNVSLSESDISQMIENGINSGDAAYDNIICNYNCDEGTGMMLNDNGPNINNGPMFGMPMFESYDGHSRFKGFEPVTFRPNVIFDQGVFTSIEETVVVFDTIYPQQQQVVTYENVDDYSIIAIDTTLYWPSIYQYVYDADGIIIDSVFSSDGSLTNDVLFYYSEAFEVINTIQIQNFVTPYGINLSLGNDGFTWIYDVTEYGYLLHDSVEIQAHNTQELIDLKFVMIEGTPPRDIVDFQQIWRGNYGQQAIAVDDKLPAVEVSTSPDATMFSVRTRATGHGMAGNGNCAEFCPTSHNLSIDGVERYEWQLWKECSDNPVYPQGGTWIFDRAGWCPGSFADTYNWNITPYVTPGDSVEIDYGMTQYPGTNGEGNYQVAVQFIQYGDYNFTTDAAIHEIVAPSTRDLYNRFNPICNNPRIQIINNGSSTLNTLTIEYGLAGIVEYSYQWTGSLEFGEVEEVVLPAMDWNDFSGDVHTFEVEISSPNGLEDEYTPNNLMFSEFETTDIYDVLVILVVKTNNYGNQTHYQVLDAEGNVRVDRDNLDDNTYYYDTLSFEPGCYELNVYDRDQGFIGQDGLNFWYWANTSYDDGTGFVKLRQAGAAYLKHFNSDFGSFFNYQFTLSDFNYQNQQRIENDYFKIYPNPGSEKVKVERSMDAKDPATIEILNLYGQKVSQYKLGSDENQMDINTEELSSGIYIFRYTCGDVSKVKKWVKK